jgi:hypothetical protein
MKALRQVLKIFLVVSCFTVVSAMGSSALAAGDKKTSQKKPKKINLSSMLETYSVEEVEQVSTYLTARVESDPLPKGEKIIKCDPPMVRVNAWLAGPMALLSEESRKQEAELYAREPSHYLNRIKGCAQKCSCSAWEFITTEGATKGVMDDKAHQANLKALKMELRKSNPRLLRKCAEKADWFCDSPMMKYLTYTKNKRK